MSTTELVTIPAVLKRMGMVSIAPPTIELNIARTVVLEGLTLSTCPSIFEQDYNYHHDHPKPPLHFCLKRICLKARNIDQLLCSIGLLMASNFWVLYANSMASILLKYYFFRRYLIRVCIRSL